MDSLVRVSRRVAPNHFARLGASAARPHTAPVHRIPPWPPRGQPRRGASIHQRPRAQQRRALLPFFKRLPPPDGLARPLQRTSVPCADPHAPLSATGGNAASPTCGQSHRPQRRTVLHVRHPSPAAVSGLFHPPLRVLFIFPSQYLFAIGLSPLFSLRWTSPPPWSCTLKQLDSCRTPLPCARRTHGTLTLSGSVFQTP